MKVFLIFFGIFVVPSSCIPEFLQFNLNTAVKNHTEWKGRLQELRGMAWRHIPVLLKARMSRHTDFTIYEYLFHQYTSLFQRSYKNDHKEYKKRFLIFVEGIFRQAALNTDKKENDTAIYGINKFSDWTPLEFQSILKSSTSQLSSSLASSSGECLLIALNNSSRNDPYVSASSNDNRCLIYDIKEKDKADWRRKVTRVKDQGECGSCWAFVASEQLESYWAIKGNPLTELSPQELLSCTPKALGCQGGNTIVTLTWLMKEKIVVALERDYPYEEKYSACRPPKVTRPGPIVKAVCGCKSMVGEEEIMLKVVDQRGPLSVNVDAVLWHDYVGGIIQHHCTNRNMNHAVQIVGYNLSDGPVKYWIAKNQWGLSFGEEGFVRIKYGQNLCGIAEQPSFIVV